MDFTCIEFITHTSDIYRTSFFTSITTHQFQLT